MAKWFTKDPAFDQEFCDKFLAAHTQAIEGNLAAWEETAEGMFALILLLDQFPRNAFRDSPRTFATDGRAQVAAEQAIAAGHDARVEVELRNFFYLPFQHAEDGGLQNRAVTLATPIGGEVLKYAELHRDIIKRFGRFPHRNAVLGRATTAAEQAFLDDGGFGG